LNVSVEAASQKKACPRGAHLRLCEKGLVGGVPAGRYTAASENKGTRVEGVRLLIRIPVQARGCNSGWLLADMARARRARVESEPWVPTDEEKQAMAEGSLIVIEPAGGPRIFIDLRAGKTST